MSDPVEAGVDAGLMVSGQKPAPPDALTEAADMLMVRHVDEFWCDPGHRQAPPNRLMRDEIVAALLTERRRAEAAMRERAERVLADHREGRLHLASLASLDKNGPDTMAHYAASNALGEAQAAIKALPLTEDTP